MATETWYAVVDGSTAAVYGVGRTEAEALADERSAAGSNGPSSLVVPCTAAAARHVQTHGGGPETRALEVSRDGVQMVGEDDGALDPEVVERAEAAVSDVREAESRRDGAGEAEALSAVRRLPIAAVRAASLALGYDVLDALED